jgi:PAS domain S-box-containing protein
MLGAVWVHLIGSGGPGWFHAGPDVATAVACILIAGGLGWFLVRRHDVQMPRRSWLFCGMLFAVGATHVIDAELFGASATWLVTVSKSVKAAAAWTAVVALIGLMPRAMKLPTAAELESADRRHQQEAVHRKRAEDELARERDLLHLLMDALPDYIYFKNRNSIIVRTNKAHAALLGRSDPENARGLNDFDFFPEEMARGYYEDEQKIMQTGESLIAKEEQVRLPNGNLSWLSTTKVATRDPNGEINGIVGISRIIDDRKKAEEAVKNSEALYSSLVETLPLSVFRCDLEGRHIFGNKAYCESHNRPLEEIVGKTDYDFFPREMAEKYRRDDQRVIDTGEVLEDVEAHLSPSGEMMYVQVVKAPVYDYRGEVVGTQGFFWDVTARKFAEERLKETAAELARSNEELERFASVASHDLQEPLRKIQAFGDRLRAKCGDQLTEQGADYLERMLNAADRMRTLINDLLTFSRVTTRGQPFVPVNLSELVGEILSDLEVRIEQTAARVEVDDLPTLDADPTQMRQLFQNLVGNALKFHREGVAPHIRIQVDRRVQVEREESAARGSAACHITVRDNGIGFDEKYTGRIFNVFQRLHGRGEYEGTGIGLAVCEKIVKRHGGSITAKSRPGEGAAFIVTLPVSHATEEETS